MEQEEIEASKLQERSLNNSQDVAIRVSEKSMLAADIIPTAGVVETFNVADGDFFYDPSDGVNGGPGGDCTTTSSGNSGDYPNCDCTTVTTLTASNLSVTFLSFNVFGTWDYLKIYDGPDTSSPQIYDSNTNGTADTYSGMVALVGNPPVFTATNGSLTFEFYATGTVNSCGWEAEISAATVACAAPENLVMDTATETTVDVSWDASPDESDGYEWVMMTPGDDPDVDAPIKNGSVQTGVTNVEVTGLTPDTHYDFYVNTLCVGGQESDWSDTLNIATNELICEIPTDLVLNLVDDTTAEFTWTASVSETNGYEWVVMAEGEDPLTDTPVNSGDVGTGIVTVTVNDLEEDTTYDFYLRTLCDNDETSNWEAPLTFTTDDTAGLNDNDIQVSLYPNPADNVLFMESKSEIDNLIIYSLSGQKLIETKVEGQNTQIDVSDFSTGLYMVRVATYSGSIGIYKFIKK